MQVKCVEGEGRCVTKVPIHRCKTRLSVLVSIFVWCFGVFLSNEFEI